MSEKNELKKEQLKQVNGGVGNVVYICNKCLGVIPDDAETKIDELQTNLNNPSTVNIKMLMKCPHCNEFVEYHRELK